jgi:hypothetical protein
MESTPPPSARPLQVSYAVEDREAPYLREVVDSLESKRA